MINDQSYPGNKDRKAQILRLFRFAVLLHMILIWMILSTNTSSGEEENTPLPIKVLSFDRKVDESVGYLAEFFRPVFLSKGIVACGDNLVDVRKTPIDQPCPCTGKLEFLVCDYDPETKEIFGCSDNLGIIASYEAGEVTNVSKVAFKLWEKTGNLDKTAFKLRYFYRYLRNGESQFLWVFTSAEDTKHPELLTVFVSGDGEALVSAKVQIDPLMSDYLTHWLRSVNCTPAFSIVCAPAVPAELCNSIFSKYNIWIPPFSISQFICRIASDDSADCALSKWEVMTRQGDVSFPTSSIFEISSSMKSYISLNQVEYTQKADSPGKVHVYAKTLFDSWCRYNSTLFFPVQYSSFEGKDRSHRMLRLLGVDYSCVSFLRSYGSHGYRYFSTARKGRLIEEQDVDKMSGYSSDYLGELDYTLNPQLGGLKKTLTGFSLIPDPSLQRVVVFFSADSKDYFYTHDLPPRDKRGEEIMEEEVD